MIYGVFFIITFLSKWTFNFDLSEINHKKIEKRKSLPKTFKKEQLKLVKIRLKL